MGNGKRAVIAGAGIAGLAAALRLCQDGWDVLVVERAQARRTGGYLVNLLGPGYDAVETLGLETSLRSLDTGLFTTVLVHPDGRAKMTVPEAVAQAALGPRTLSTFRGDLESVLFAKVRDCADVRFGTTVEQIHQDADGVQARISDGTSEHADLLIGADGLHSATRTALFGDGFEVEFPYVVGAFPLNQAPAGIPESSATTFIGPGRTASIVNVGPGRSSAFFAYRCKDPAADLRRGPAEALCAKFGDLGGATSDALIQLCRNPERAYFDRTSQVALDRWSSGRVVLLGDAAWCVTLFAGHGAALALAGADRLGTALSRHDGDVPAALAEWEAAMRPEVLKRQRNAYRGMRQFVPPSHFHVLISELTIRAVTLPGIRNLVRRGIERSAR